MLTFVREPALGFCKMRCDLVLVGQDGVSFGNGPVDLQFRAVPDDGAFGDLAVERSAFVLHFGVLFERDKAVQEAGRNPELGPVFGGEFGGDPFAIGRRARAGVDGHVPDGTARDADELALLVRRKLAVQAANDAFLAGQALVVLNERQVDTGFAHALHIVGFGEEAAIVTKTGGVTRMTSGMERRSTFML